MKALKMNSVNVLIFTDLTVLCPRIKKDQGRPSLTGKALEDEMHEVWEKRRGLYLEYADHVWDDTQGGHLKRLQAEDVFRTE